ncbi:hypothetical protein BJ875DRAFT_476426 [Amylocarpus encephaloides]|uniref:Uncharacterized protein n=1 Tax=Amylocarpus encephaloides TaxID=45428 RepID=A0A9P8C063_9HELO|nr:hypothetical protein BJ875DRAFT_476426 [Amylocarpus encephaloides]
MAPTTNTLRRSFLRIGLDLQPKKPLHLVRLGRCELNNVILNNLFSRNDQYLSRYQQRNRRAWTAWKMKDRVKDTRLSIWLMVTTMKAKILEWGIYSKDSRARVEGKVDLVQKAKHAYSLFCPSAFVAHDDTSIAKHLQTNMEWTRIGPTRTFQNISQPTPWKGSTVAESTVEAQ